MPPAVVHLDADAFFASVEQAADPRLRGRPVAVGGARRGIIASASYEARRFGIYTPMPSVQARRLCPQLILLPGDFEKYERFSRWMFSYAYDFTPDIEIGSIDEGYLDLSAVRQPPLEVARTIRDAIRQSLKITVSEGLGTNKLVSQIASKLNKPAAFLEVPRGGETSFLHPLPNRWLPGVGPKTAQTLNAAGLTRIGQIAVTPPDQLELIVGSAAPTLRRFAQGLDDRPIVPVRAPAQSYSQQETFAQDQTDEPFLEATLRRMADHLFAQVRAAGQAVRTLTVRVRYNDMAEDQCSESLSEPTALETDVYGRLHLLLRQAWKRRVSLRLISLKLTHLYAGAFCAELPLHREARRQDAAWRLARAVDELRTQHGRSILLRGHDFVLANRQPGSPTLNPQSPSSIPNPKSKIQNPKSKIPNPQCVPRLAFTPLIVRSHYSFLNSTLAPAAIVAWARTQGLSTVALCDQDNLHGAVEFAQAAHAAGLRPLLGAEVRVRGRPVRLFVENATGYANLCRLLSPPPRTPNSELRTPNSAPDEDDSDGAAPAPLPLRASDRQISGDTAGLIAIATEAALARLFPGRFYLGVAHPDAARHLENPDRLPVVAAPPVHYATAADRWKFDIVQSIRTLTLLRQPHPDKRLDSTAHFRTAREMAAWFRGHEDWLTRTQEIAERCAGFALPLGPPQFPAFRPPDGSTPRAFLRTLVLAGARHRYPATHGPAPATVWSQIETELQIIHDVGYEEYFLVVWDLLQDCRRQGIDWITRGSAADSLVCYCLGISSVCPIRFDLYFRRFLNPERMALHKLPDIDIDFPHDRKDDVVNLLLAKYGPDHSAVVGGFSTFQARSAFAETAKVLGVAERDVRRFTEHFPWSFGGHPEVAQPSNPKSPLSHLRTPHSALRTPHSALRTPNSELPTAPSPEGRLHARLRASPETCDLPLDEEPYRSALIMAEALDGVPRYPKMHPCGVVLSRQPMHTLTPTFRSGKGWPATQFDMDAVEAIGLVKIDILAQGGLAAMRDTRTALRQRGLEVDWVRFETTPTPPAPPQSQISNLKSQISDFRFQISNLKSQISIPSSSPPALDLPIETPRLLPSPASPIQNPKSKIENPDAPVPLLFDGAPNPWRFDDPAVWDMIAGGGARAVHHIESPAMTTLCRMTGVREIDGLIAIVSVIRPGAANEHKKLAFTRRYQQVEPPVYPHPCLEPCLRSTFGLVVYEEHILQISEAFAGLTAGRADVLRRALVKRRTETIGEIGREFAAGAGARGHDAATIREVWDLVTGFSGYAFCKAHSTAYGVEAYQSAWLKCHFPAEFMAAVLTHGKGFYHPLVYVLEAARLGVRLLPPSVNEPGPEFQVVAGPPPALRAPVPRLKGLTTRTADRLLAERARAAFASLADFYRRVAPSLEEMDILIRGGALDEFGRPRTGQFWDARRLHRVFGQEASGQGWLFPEPGGNAAHPAPSGAASDRVAGPDLTEPTRLQRLQWEMDLLGFTVSGHPLDLYPDVAWDTYCPVASLGEHVGHEVVTCGLVIEQRVHHQVTGEPMKFLTLADWTGMVETELFARTYRSYGLATVRYPVLEVTGRVEPFENGSGHTLRVLRAGPPRRRLEPSRGSERRRD